LKKSIEASGAVLISAAVLLAANIVMAHTPSQPPHQLFNEGDLKLESGDVIKDFSISYVTHGTLNARNRMRS
jgi:homoserine O-acetyltransferase/O-succinyltransferase